MSNALMTLTNGKGELTDAERLILAEMQDDQNAYDMHPAKVKIAPGGIGQFLMGDDTSKTFTAIVAISQKIRGYWPGEGTGAPPICSSPDGNRGIFNPEPSDEQFKAASSVMVPHPGIVFLTENEPLPDFFSCSRCPMDQWASGKGKSKACKSMRRLLLLIDGWTLPALMSLPPTSLRAWDGYCSALAAKRSAYFAVRTKFELDSANSATGEKYNFVKVSVAGAIEDTAHLQAVAEIRKQYRDLVGGLPVDAEEYETRETAEESVVPF